jgi:hypothetical protein
LYGLNVFNKKEVGYSEQLIPVLTIAAFYQEPLKEAVGTKRMEFCKSITIIMGIFMKSVSSCEI